MLYLKGSGIAVKTFFFLLPVTVESHVRALEITHAVTLVRPFHGGGQHELVKQPKIYAFDTGFVSFARGWDPLRQDDLGLLWEHLVLEHVQAHFPDTPVRYWRDKLRARSGFRAGSSPRRSGCHRMQVE